MTHDLLFEIGCEELPASFVDAAVSALPELITTRMVALRLTHGEVTALGTPRRLALIVRDLGEHQADLDEEVMGPPVSAAFKDGAPTKAAEAFAAKLGVAVGELERVATPKGEYLRGRRRELGTVAAKLLPAVLAELVRAIPFRKSMRWGSGTFSFGRPVKWLLARLDEEVVPVELEGLSAGGVSYGHRFLHPAPVPIPSPGSYIDKLREARVVVDPKERSLRMLERLEAAASSLGGTLIDDAFLVRENLSLVEDPQVVAGGFEAEFLALPEEVILEVARGHQRYFCVRGHDGRLLPSYLAVVNTAESPEQIRRGNDRVMRARLSDARFFHGEDLKRSLASRRSELGGIVFQNRLGSVLAKVERIERLVATLGDRLALPAETVSAAVTGAGLAKCDLVTWMVREFPELEGQVGRAYALAQDNPVEVADVIRDHYKPKGAGDVPSPGRAGALVALSDRLDTLVGCFAVGLTPTGAADPFALRRACITTLRTLLAHAFELSLGDAIREAHRGYVAAGVTLDLGEEELTSALLGFFRDRLRGLLSESLPADAVEAALFVAQDRPLDAKARAEALSGLDRETRAKVGEVFKRATNIAKDAQAGAPQRGTEAAEQALYDGFFAVKDAIEACVRARDYASALRRVAEIAPLLATFFDEVMVLADDEAVRTSRLCLMRAIRDTCSSLAALELLAVEGAARARRPE
ncbi:MAG: glycine--tRNA ligase subunit beta [Myxococcales bacterium]|nr:glycine--tRNA ligase subunit beta [Myxococcales bacterium]